MLQNFGQHLINGHGGAIQVLGVSRWAQWSDGPPGILGITLFYISSNLRKIRLLPLQLQLVKATLRSDSSTGG